MAKQNNSSISQTIQKNEIAATSTPQITGTSNWDNKISPELKKLEPTVLTQIGFSGAMRQKLDEKGESARFLVSHEAPAILMILEKISSKIQFQTNKFLLQALTKPQQEKFQVIETFGKPHVFFYGERTKMYTMQGVLLDGFYRDELTSGSASKLQFRNKWSLSLQDFYNKELRGTRLKDNGNIAGLYVNGWLIKGYPVQLSIMKESNQLPDAVTFQMSWVVDSEILLNTKLVEQHYDIKTTLNETEQTKINELMAAISKYGQYVEELNDLPKSKLPEITAKKKLIDEQYDLILSLQKTLADLQTKNITVKKTS